jgi:uncharacterized protein YggE
MRRAIVLAAALVAGAMGASPAWGQQGEAAFRTTTLNISAQGEVRTVPEIATLVIGATWEAATAQGASAEANGRVNAAVQALRKAGVAQRDIQTQQVQITPKYSDRSGGPVRIIAYEATTMVSVIARDPGRAGDLLDTAMGAGANQVRGVRYGLADPGKAQREARDQALRALQDDAARVADVMGQRVVRLVRVDSQGWSQVMSANRIEEIVVTGTRIEPGELVVRTSVSGLFELTPK